IEVERPDRNRDVLGVDPVRDPDIVVRKQRADGVAKECCEVTGERSENNDARELGAAVLHEVQQAAEGLFDFEDFAYGVSSAADLDGADFKRWTVVSLREPRHQIERGCEVAAAGKIRKWAVGMSVKLVGRLGEQAPGFERRALPVIKLV